MQNNNTFSIIALIIAILVGTIYITREISADRTLKDKIEKLETTKDSLDKAVKSLITNTNQKDKSILENIKASYEQIDKLAKQNQGIHNVVENQLNNVDSLINIILKENEKNEKP